MSANNIFMTLSGLGLNLTTPFKHSVELVLLCGVNAGSLVAIQVDPRGFLVLSGTNQ